MTSERVPKRVAIADSQVLLKQESPGLAIDGLWGPKTDGAYTRASLGLKNSVGKRAIENGWTIEGLRYSGMWISAEQAKQLCFSAASEFNVPYTALLYMLSREPLSRTSLNGLEYRADSVSPGGGYFGLMQMGRPAWADAFKEDQSIGGFAANWTDPVQNIRAAALFIRVNMRYAKEIHNYHGPFTDEVLYAMHNQGHTFISEAKKGRLGKWASSQSSKAQRSLQVARSHVMSMNEVASRSGKLLQA